MTDFSVEKPDIERNLRTLLFEREAEIVFLRKSTEEWAELNAKAGREIERLTQRLQAALQTVLDQGAEIERLRAERDEGARWRRQGEAELRAEVERLRAEIELVSK
jgi:hypothetical protein